MIIIIITIIFSLLINFYSTVKYYNSNFLYFIYLNLSQIGPTNQLKNV